MPQQKISEIVAALQELMDDVTVPRNVKLHLQNTLNALQKEDEMSLCVSRALHELDEIADDSNVEPYTRSQIWNVVSLLETL